MCQSMVNIQSPTSEIRRGKKRREGRTNHSMKIYMVSLFHRATINQDNPIKTIGRDSFLSPKTPKNTSFLGVNQPPGVVQSLYSRGHN